MVSFGLRLSVFCTWIPLFLLPLNLLICKTGLVTTVTQRCRLAHRAALLASVVFVYGALPMGSSASDAGFGLEELRCVYREF
jgi:hypothetical protein